MPKWCRDIEVMANGLRFLANASFDVIKVRFFRVGGDRGALWRRSFLE